MLHSAPSITPFSLVAYKPASAYLDSPLHGSTSISRGAVHLSVLTVPCLSYSMHHGRSIRTCPCRYAFSLFISPIAHTVSSYGLLQQHYADDTQFHVAISKDNYNTPVVKLELCLSTLHTWICYNGLALNPDKSEAIVFGTTQH